MNNLLKRNYTPFYLQHLQNKDDASKSRFNNKQKRNEMDDMWPRRRNTKRWQKKPNKLVSSRACNVSGIDLSTLSNDQRIFVTQKRVSASPKVKFPDSYDVISDLAQPKLVNRSQSPLKVSSSSPACILNKDKSIPSLCTDDNLDHLDSLDEIVPLIYRDEQEQAIELKEASVQFDKLTAFPKRIHIAEIPRIKFIAEQYMRYQKDNLELRKLKEKIICVEYDVFDISEKTYKEQLEKDRYQILRAFFSLKPKDANVFNGQDSFSVSQVPQSIKHTFKIADEDLKKLNEKEIQMIDSKIAENKPYLEDLKRVLIKKQERKTSGQPTLDLQYLYEMAQRECLLSDSKFTKLLTPNEMNEVKDMILTRGMSSVHGIRKRILKKPVHENIVSQSTLFHEIDV